jgi:hypothetical protein
MARKPDDSRSLSPAKRGQIIQRVLVDGWPPRRAGAPFGVTERQVIRWVAAYRRDGMASLRDGAGAAGGKPWFERLVTRIGGALRGGLGIRGASARCVMLRQRAAEARPPVLPSRRPLWN